MILTKTKLYEKDLFFHFSVLAMLIVLISACSSKKSEYTNVIPSDASQVIAVNLKSLADKAGTKDKKLRSTAKADRCLEKRYECSHFPTAGNGAERSE